MQELTRDYSYKTEMIIMIHKIFFFQRKQAGKKLGKTSMGIFLLRFCLSVSWILQVYLGPWQISAMELFAKIFNG